MLTLLFSSYNGVQTLPRMLERLTQIKVPGPWRIVAVDNRSTDGTFAALAHAAAVLPITILQCPDPGKNRALNFALDQISDALDDNDLVIVSDDDILPDEDWLIELTKAAASRPDVNVFGGTIRSAWPEHVPEWIHQLEGEHPVLFATTDAAEGPCNSRQIYGPNMAVRACVFKRGTRFNPGIGPDGTKDFGMGSESDLLRRLERDGERMYFCERAVVRHQIKPSLLKWEPVLSRARRFGLGLDRLDAIELPLLVRATRTIKRELVSETKALLTLLPVFANRRAPVLFWRAVHRGRMQSLLQPVVGPALHWLTRPITMPGTRLSKAR